jgi:glucose-specific phosphotransferase system IIA component
MLKKIWNSTFGLLQRLGQALMVPVSILPAAGLMVALGRLCTDLSSNAASEKHSAVYFVGKVLYGSGIVIFEQLALVFSVGVAIGFTGGSGIAGLAAVAGFFSFQSVIQVYTQYTGLTPAINTGVLGGICVGLLVSALYHRFSEVKLHPVLGFFSGKRLVPILSTLASVGLAFLFVVIWPGIQNEIHEFGVSVMASPHGPSLYASVKRLLIPVGLHHVFYPSFLYEFGEFTTSAGQVVRGEATRYFAGDPSAGRFMASEFPMMIFGLPAACLAMVMRAKPERRKAIAGMMLSAALTSIITGITEPIEFAFTFVAPLLYIVHASLAFVSGMLTNYFDIHLGYTFSSSLIDLALGYFNQKNVSKLFFVVGPIMAILYFCSFYFLIGFFKFKTPGREDAESVQDEEENPHPSRNSPLALNEVEQNKAAKILVALGGAKNIISIDACITRLRLQLRNTELLNEGALRKLGASGLMKAGGGNVQVVMGVESDFIKIEIQKIIQNDQNKTDSDTGFQVKVRCPIQGKRVNLDQVPDDTFKNELMGPTVIVLPTPNPNGLTPVLSPFSGAVTMVFRTGHALGLESDDGIELLIHIGIDTVKLDGVGFYPKVKAGDRVELGQVLIEYDYDQVEQKAKSMLTPIVITNADANPGLQRLIESNIVVNNQTTLWF